MDPRLDTESCGSPVCPGGCGLPLSASRPEEHCCVEALRALADALLDRSAAQEHQARMERLGWARREQRLMAQTSRAQSQVKLTEVQSQRRLHQYVLQAGAVVQQVLGLHQGQTRTNDVQNQLEASWSADAAPEVSHGSFVRRRQCVIFYV
ncbi:unnamed protein product [Knipowitschia caucasica]